MSTARISPEAVTVALALLLSGLLFVPALTDPVNPPKLAVLVLGAGLLLVLAPWRLALRRRKLPPQPRPALVVAAALGVALVVASVTAMHPSLSWWGALGRNSGLLAYLAALVVFVTIAVCFARAEVTTVLVALGGTGVLAAAYGAVQLVGADPFTWSNPFNPMIGTLGNPNFAAAHLAVATPPLAAGALWAGWPTAARAGCAGAAIFCFAVSTLSESVQGPLAAVAGLGVLMVGAALTSRRIAPGRALAAVGALAVTGLLLLGAGVAGSGPLVGAFSGISFQARKWYWEAALRMLADRPLLGVGVDNYRIAWRQVRPDAATARLGDDHLTDAAHSVPLMMFAQGGVLLGLAYLAFVGVTAYYLVIGLRRLRGEPLLLMMAAGGAWAAYQVQSLVSIDQVPLMLLHVVTAGCVVAIARGEVVVAPPPRGRQRAAASRRPPSLAAVAVAGVVSLVAAAGAVSGFVPWRASAAVSDGDDAMAVGKAFTAVQHYKRATELQTSTGRWWNRLGDVYLQLGDLQSARRTYTKALRHDPYDVTLARDGAAVLAEAGDVEAAKRTFRRAVELEPTHLDTVLVAADYHLQHGGAEQARAMLEQILGVHPASAALWATVGDARLVLGKRLAAEEAYGRALLLDAQQPRALDGQRKLATGAA